MQPDLVAALACPLDGGELQLDGRTLACGSGHRFDLARQGYATLIAAPLAHTGDTPAMLDRRSRVHGAGLLAAVHAAVVDALADADDRTPAGADDRSRADAGEALRDSRAHAGRGPALPDGIVCDVGTGPGTYLASVLDALPGRAGLGVDVSKAAARRAARCHPRAGAVVADVWRGLPLRDGAVAVLLDVFAPRNPAEFARVVAPSGTLVVVTPGSDHLAGLRERVGMLDVPAGKAEQVAGELAPAFRPAGTRQVHQQVEVTPELAVDLATMGPSGHHLDPVALGREVALPATGRTPSSGPQTGTAGPAPPTLSVTIAATISRFQRR